MRIRSFRHCVLVSLLAASSARAESYSDWLEATNDEWVQGWVSGMQDELLTFESDSFSTLYLDWSSVRRLHVTQHVTWVFKDLSTVVGTGDFEQGKLTVNGRSYPAHKLDGITVGGERELQYWHLGLSSGLTFQRGSVSQLIWTNFVDVRRDDGLTRTQVQYTGSLGAAYGDITTNKHTGIGQFDIKLTSILYAMPFFGMLTHDLEQNISLRAVAAVGAGVMILDQSKFTWSLGGGPGYQSTVPITVDSGEDEESHGFALVLNTRAQFEWTDDLKLSAQWVSLIAVTDLDRSYHRLTASLHIALIDKLTVDINTIFERSEDPNAPTNEDGLRISDLELVVGLGVSL